MFDKKNVFEVALEIYDKQISGNEHHFGSLVKVLDGRISRNEISKCIDILTDTALLTEKLVKRDDGWCRLIIITNDGIPLVKEWMDKICIK